MPHKPRAGNQPTPKSEQSRLLFLQGAQQSSKVVDLDPKAQPFVEALLLLLGEGMTIHIRPGSGGGSIGIGGYDGDTRIPYKWLYDNEEIDDWAESVRRALGSRFSPAAD
jgi:hypothetical protein